MNNFVTQCFYNAKQCFLIFYFFFVFVLQTHVIFPHLVVSNDPTYFPEPKKFLPERWLKQNGKYYDNKYNKNNNSI